LDILVYGVVMKTKLFFCLITTLIFAFNLFAASNVTLAWDPDTDTNIAGYKIYYGPAAGVYTNTVDVGNVTNATISSLVTGTTYHFAATAYDTSALESDYSNEAIFTNTVSNVSITYVGVKVDYGTGFASLISVPIMVMSITNNPGYFYNEYLIITNNPIIGIRPMDTNKYVYVGTMINYGPGIINLTSSTFQLMAFMNPPNNQFYRGSLIITNHPF
jgi:hypothetical protein